MRNRLITSAWRPLTFAFALVFASSVGSAVQAETSAEEIEVALAASDRSDEDKARDESRKPAEVLAFFGVEPGITAIDLIAASGWYTEVLAAAVGPEGKVYAQNPKVMLEFRDGYADKAMTARLTDNRLPNVERLDKEMTELGLEPGSIDFALTALNFHDVYNENAEQGVGMLKGIFALLKPGGVLGLTDHNGKAEADNKALHRIHKPLAIDAAKAAGFEVEESDVLSNDTDDHTIMVFDEAIRGKTDRFVLKLTKPE